MGSPTSSSRKGKVVKLKQGMVQSEVEDEKQRRGIDYDSGYPGCHRQAVK